MVDYNLGEKYADKFVSVRNEPIDNLYDFDEFSDFGKSYLWNPSVNSSPTIYDRLYEVLDWARNASQHSDSSPVESEEPIESEEPTETTAKTPYILHETPQYVSHIGKFDINSAINKLHYLTNYKLEDRYDTSKWIKKGTHDSGTWCARAVSLAMEAGGLNTNWRPKYAGNYGERMVNNGWTLLPDDTTTFQRGDVCVIKGLGTKGRGHISMYDGKLWVSDFYQNGWDVYHGRAKRGKNTHFYRYNG